MLATFVIGLREGLEAALIVGIIAGFLRRNGRSLVPMWVGVGLALALSLAVGIGLKLVESSLPQAAQEGMESVIGGVAVVFVTTMILWMARHARGMKRELESSAQVALGDGTSRALAVMAFLAVLKEGFESAVFLLATFQASGTPGLAALGALLGFAGAVALGWGLYKGSVRIDLGRFFKITSAFLILVAAGLVLTTLRTAHEAGWLSAGQQRTVDLSFMAAPGSVLGSLLTGVLGIPPDPRLIEVIGWFAYLIPMALIVYWPLQSRPDVRTGLRIRYAVAAALAVAAGVLGVTVSAPAAAAAQTAALLDGSGVTGVTGVTVGTASTQESNGTTTLVVDLTGQATQQVLLTGGTAEEHAGIAATHVSQSLDAASAGTSQQALPPTLTATELTTLVGGRLPVGVDVKRSPGPYTATWTQSGTRDTWLVGTGSTLLDTTQRQSATLTLSGGGLTTPKTITVGAAATLPGGARMSTGTWVTSPDYVTAAAGAVRDGRSAASEARFWGRTIPFVLLLAAAAVLLVAFRRRQSLAPVTTTSPKGRLATVGSGRPASEE